MNGISERGNEIAVRVRDQMTDVGEKLLNKSLATAQTYAENPTIGKQELFTLGAIVVGFVAGAALVMFGEVLEDELRPAQ